jgi:hypothetical protein
MKAIGTGWSRGVAWQDVEVTRVPGGRPTVTLHRKPAEFFYRLGLRNRRELVDTGSLTGCRSVYTVLERPTRIGYHMGKPKYTAVQALRGKSRFLWLRTY